MEHAFNFIFTISCVVLFLFTSCVKDLKKSGNCSVDFSLFVLKSTCMRQSNTYESRQTAREKKKTTKKKNGRRKAVRRKTWKKK